MYDISIPKNPIRGVNLPSLFFMVFTIYLDYTSRARWVPPYAILEPALRAGRCLEAPTRVPVQLKALASCCSTVLAFTVVVMLAVRTGFQKLLGNRAAKSAHGAGNQFDLWSRHGVHEGRFPAVMGRRAPTGPDLRPTRWRGSRSIRRRPFLSTLGPLQ